jgi:hypothetical protein
VARKGGWSGKGEGYDIIAVNDFNVCGYYFATTVPAIKKQPLVIISARTIE